MAEVKEEETVEMAGVATEAGKAEVGMVAVETVQPQE
jgi:hypothetical protein